MFSYCIRGVLGKKGGARLCIPAALADFLPVFPGWAASTGRGGKTRGTHRPDVRRVLVRSSPSPEPRMEQPYVPPLLPHRPPWRECSEKLPAGESLSAHCAVRRFERQTGGPACRRRSPRGKVQNDTEQACAIGRKPDKVASGRCGGGRQGQGKPPMASGKGNRLKEAHIRVPSSTHPNDGAIRFSA